MIMRNQYYIIFLALEKKTNKPKLENYPVICFAPLASCLVLGNIRAGRPEIAMASRRSDLIL